MKHVVRALALASILVAAGQSLAWATWSAPLAEWGVILPYGAACATGTHRGIDLAAPAGSVVLAPVAGTVTFAGRVPAAGGGTCGAVTVETSDGLRISLLPLEGLSVDTGGQVTAGGEVGSLAAGGDGSSAETHLHIGLRRGDAYLDPGSLLPPAGMPAASLPVTTPATSAGTTPETPVALPASGVISAAAASAPAPVASMSAAAATAEPQHAEPPTSVSALMSGFSIHVPVEAGVPSASALRPELHAARDKFQVNLQPPSGQAVLSVALLLGMLATVAGIARPRLAAVRD